MTAGNDGQRSPTAPDDATTKTKTKSLPECQPPIALACMPPCGKSKELLHHANKYKSPPVCITKSSKRIAEPVGLCPNS
eukprot:CAMPEP_0169323594 /NCGR_PEP_ID=MMETSP1017-20121227/10035_1 /TAXON_ID=342587 /ORGANISM="Karlodinium micrum, Strain CCMP2283" /LENGTH=78 /DNA_ID=CAMNT_0009418211 /DNA_START=2848 /DNA_END=3081 /DNA_ORIENTATION=+